MLELARRPIALNKRQCNVPLVLKWILSLHIFVTRSVLLSFGSCTSFVTQNKNPPKLIVDFTLDLCDPIHTLLKVIGQSQIILRNLTTQKLGNLISISNN